MSVTGSVTGSVEGSVTGKREQRANGSTSRSARSGRGLASARDRRRLREREAAERARVERALATAPLPTEPNPGPIRARAGKRSTSRVVHLARTRAALRGSVPRPSPRCSICAGSDVLLDEVVHDGQLLRLGQCGRCSHRWTERPRDASGSSDASGAGAGTGTGTGTGRANDCVGSPSEYDGGGVDGERALSQAERVCATGRMRTHEAGLPEWGVGFVGDPDLLTELPF